MLLDLLASHAYLMFHIKINDESPKHDSKYNSPIQSKDW